MVLVVATDLNVVYEQKGTTESFTRRKTKSKSRKNIDTQ